MKLHEIWSNVETITPKLFTELCDSPLCWSFGTYRHSDLVKRSLRHSYTFNIYLDDIPNDQRLCIECKLGYVDTWIRATALSEYDDVKNCWNHWHGERSLCIDGKKGRKPLIEYRDNLWNTRHSYRSNGNQFKFSATKKNGIWHIYGC